MKKLYFFLVIILVCEINSQILLEGIFVIDHDESKVKMHGEQYSFKNDGTFEYYEWSDLLPHDFGKGTYELYDSLLILNFMDLPEMHDTLLFIDNEFNLAEDTVKYNIQLFDFKTRLPIQYGSVKLKYMRNILDTLKKSVFLIQDYITEKVYFMKDNIPEYLEIQSLSGGVYKYYINDKLSRNMRVYLKDMEIDLDYIGPKQDKILIRKITKDNFELYKYEEWRPYKRM
jgi:hypothetical protein